MKQRMLMIVMMVCSLMLNDALVAAPVHTHITQQRMKQNTPRVFYASPNDPVVTITLDANPSTGYQWYVNDIQSYLIDEVSYAFEKASGQPTLGQGGQVTWKLTLDEEAFNFPQRIVVNFIHKGPGTSTENITIQPVWIFTAPFDHES